MFSTLAIQHPIFTMFLYILLCGSFGVGLFFSYSFIRKKIEIRKNMKVRAQRDKSC